MTSPVFEYLEQINWLDTCHQIPSWHDKGIRHGFEGVGHELPPFGLHLKQIHSVDIMEVKTEGSQGLVGQGDALATRLASHRIAVKTADCLPILVHHHDIVMAIHAGWRGLAQDFVGRVAAYLRQEGVDPAKCEWGIGPCIAQSSFEVGPEVMAAFAQNAPFAETIAWSALHGKGDRWHLDLATIAALRLMQEGVPAQQLHVIRTDTRTLEDVWHSYRRSGEQAGRNWSWIEQGVPFVTGHI